jgi:hypothetical protein
MAEPHDWAHRLTGKNARSIVKSSEINLTFGHSVGIRRCSVTFRGAKFPERTPDRSSNHVLGLLNVLSSHRWSDVHRRLLHSLGPFAVLLSVVFVNSGQAITRRNVAKLPEASRRSLSA